MAQLKAEGAAERPPAHAAPEPLPARSRGKLTLLLAIEPVEAERLKRGGIAALWPAARATTSRRREVAWDTAGLALGRAGSALVTERQGAARHQAERDLMQPPAAGRYCLAMRRPLAGLAPASGSVPTAELMPCFGMTIVSTAWRLPVADSIVVAQLQAVVTEAAGAVATARYLELVLERGRPQDLYAAARQLRQHAAFGLARLDHVQAGYRLIAPDLPWPAAASELAPDMPVRAGLVRIARRLLADFRAATARLRADPDEEAVHQARVSIRRLRSMLSVFGKALPRLPRALLSGELNAVAKLLGEVREADVWLAETLAPLGHAVGPDPVVSALAAAAAQKRVAGVEAIAACLAGPRFLMLELELGQWFDADVWPMTDAAQTALLASPLLPFARALLQRRHERLVEAGAGLQAADAAAMHAVRILAKKLRYAAEFLRPLFGAARAARYIDALKQVQEVLGSANDAAVSTSRLAAHLLGHGQRFDTAAEARASGLVTGWSAAEGHAARKQLAQLWRAFERTPRFWKV